MSELVGNTPVLRVTAPLPEPHPGFWAKLEGMSPGGMKSRAALSMVVGARRRGELRAGGTIVESTSGTLGIGLAYVGIALGHPVVLVTDHEIDNLTLALLRAYGARVEIVREPAPRGGWQRARRDRVAELLAEHEEAFWPDQYNNPDNAAGYEPLGRELLAQFDRVDTVVCSVGTGGHSAGVASVLRAHLPNVRIVGVDSPGSALFGQRPDKRLMRGLGSSIHPDNVAYHQFDEVHWIGPSEAARACRDLARGNFVTGGWSTGAVALASAWCAAETGSDEVVGIFPDGPHRYWETIYDDEFGERNGLHGTRCARHPAERGTERSGAARWSRSREITDPCPGRTTGTGCSLCDREEGALP
ncbi:pyridoxal-5'-phosphate-dependent protein subunit beta [Actinopolyspora erythraea]|uniref:Pyridoxal-5'-phosphate-dependent protein subunit beta n=1 Tax=Actinopolyspora erythraea TaxID=414996 RepID=A0A223RYA7_9ACTN|nr:pyridoxal-5'-phosphate-dependent protein subunit beta [Actinopolyspora erythraea]